MGRPSWVDGFERSLEEGVRAVSAPSLFPTPPELARRAVELADIEPGYIVLEPSAGTGAILDALPSGIYVRAVERSQALADALRQRPEYGEGLRVYCEDFLDWTRPPGFDRVVMNPPFDRGEDIKHVRHALEMLRPGGRLVAIVAGGPRQAAAFKEDAETWEELPSGTFAGTAVRSVLFSTVKPAPPSSLSG